MRNSETSQGWPFLWALLGTAFTHVSIGENQNGGGTFSKPLSEPAFSIKCDEGSFPYPNWETFAFHPLSSAACSGWASIFPLVL